MNILSWNPVIYGNNTFPLPTITISLKEFNKNIPSLVKVNIQETGMPYDNNILSGVIDIKKDFVVITLFCGWLGYPEHKGKVSILNQENADKVAVAGLVDSVANLQTPLPFFANTKMGQFTPVIETYHVNSGTLLISVILIILIIVAIFLPL